jgi:3-carboxy-cis,cis-muconate cycloisomerase
MPHKRNPQLCQDVVGLTAELRALVPLALEAAMSEHEADNWASVGFDTARRASELTAESLARVDVIVSGLRIDAGRMRENLLATGGLIVSEAVMLQLGQRLGRQTAHEVVYRAAQHCAATGVAFEDALLADPKVTGVLSADTVAGLLDPAAYVGEAPGLAIAQAAAARNAIGSAATPAG